MSSEASAVGNPEPGPGRTGTGTNRPGAHPHHRRATFALVGVTAVWGSTFVVVAEAIDKMPVLPFLFWRFLVAALILAAFRPRAVLALDADKRRHGVILGILLGLGYVTQTFGLAHTSATVAGFVTGMFVVFTPIIAAVISRKPVGGMVWVSVALATAGLAVISLHGSTIGFGELLTLACAALFAGHIVGLSRWSTAADTYGLTVLQLSVVTLMCLVASLFTGGVVGPPDRATWLAIVFLAVFATALGFLTQTWAQTLMTAPRAAIVLTMEPVFSGIFGITIGGDPLTWRILLGGGLIVAAMYVVELAPPRSAVTQ
jgi:drug/metabolite transporter (DMT)-like permease